MMSINISLEEKGWEVVLWIKAEHVFTKYK